MSSLRRIILSSIFATLVCLMAGATPPTYTNESLSYRVTYKWGLIQKQAGSAQFNLRKTEDGYSAMLTARTQPWADRIFQVRDTLRGTMRNGDMAPTQYIKSTHEGGEHRHDVIRYSFEGDRMIAHCERLKIDKKGRVETSDTILSATMPGTDMISVYYLVRRLPFDTMKIGTVATASIFSGKKIETLGVKYLGEEIVTLNGISYKCYKINFTFSSERMKNSSAPMWAWIRTDGDRVPVKLIGELPIGEIQVLWNDPDMHQSK